MRHRYQFFSAGYYIVWTLFLVAFVAIGGGELWIGSQGKFIESGPFASTDSYLEALLGIRNGSQTCLEVISKLHRRHAIVYFCPPQNPEGDFVYDALAYLSWPQKIDKVEIDRAALEQKIASIDQASAAAFIFFEMQPPSGFGPLWRIGPHLFVAPLKTEQ